MNNKKDVTQSHTVVVCASRRLPCLSLGALLPSAISLCALRTMHEKEFVEQTASILQSELEGYAVTTGSNLLYKVVVTVVDDKLCYFPKNPKDPKTRSLAFQTDLLVSRDGVPLVVVEAKHGSFSTHDVLTYSAKAMKHKEVYPYLRYGFLVGGQDRIQKKFFTHNMGFDFAIAVEDVNNLQEFIEVVHSQVASAEKLLEIYKKTNRLNVAMYNTTVEVRYD